MKSKTPAIGIVLIALIACLAPLGARRPPTALAEAPPHRLYLPLAIVPAPPSTGRTLDVPTRYRTIGAALAAARAGDVVRAAEGTYIEIGLEVPAGVTLRGAGWRRTTIAKTANTPPTILDGPGRGVIVAMGAGATVEDVRISDNDGAAVGIAIDGAGRHTVRGVMFDQLAVGVAGVCLDGPTCVANLDVRRALFLNCEAAGIDADERTLLTADHLTFRTPLGARIRRPGSELTNSVFDLDDGDIGIDNGTVDIGPRGIAAHHNLFGPHGRRYTAWIPAVEGDLIADPLLAPMDWWPTPLSPARHAASDGSDIGALPFADIGSPPTDVRAERDAPPSPGTAAPWVVSWTPVPNAWIYHVVASPASGGAASLQYTYDGGAGADGGPRMRLDWLEPDKAYWIAVSTGYAERGESEAAEPVYVGADGG
ncbi:MAG: hypothetical protein ABI780_06765 [Ardenticatenales bacterium]